MMESMMEPVKEEAKAQLKKQIESGEFSLGEGYNVSIIKAFLNTKVQMQGNGDANVTVTNDEGQSVTFTMRKKDGYWEVYKIDMTLEELQELNTATETETETETEASPSPTATESPAATE
jgi:hypothetical protein